MHIFARFLQKLFHIKLLDFYHDMKNWCKMFRSCVGILFAWPYFSNLNVLSWNSPHQGDADSKHWWIVFFFLSNYLNIFWYLLRPSDSWSWLLVPPLGLVRVFITHGSSKEYLWDHVTHDPGFSSHHWGLVRVFVTHGSSTEYLLRPCDSWSWLLVPPLGSGQSVHSSQLK